MIGLDNLQALILRLKAVYNEQKIYLSELDSAIGDGDHGVNMSRGFDAVVAAWNEAPPADFADAFKRISMALIKTVGGASGPLYGTFFMKMGAAIGKKTEFGLDEWIDGVEKGIAGIAMMGKAQRGDKTMLDAWEPALEALKAARAAGRDLAAALSESAQAAEQGMAATIPMVAKKGRASYLGERSAGHQDPGATSTAMLLKAAAENF
ncbi:MAG: dihydroxyacetone kinase subunit L [Treponema sp.]|jgi:dihydroxyacetone kinase-like protein|nr:dihydroxyacetone kinase subunit L [Treponema sp.]